MAENFFGITDTGKVRDNNEDAFIAKKVLNNKFIIACAIDGVGGYSGGEIAAEIARESIFENFAKPSGDLIAAMKASFILANEKIFAEKLQTKEHSKMACVLTLAVVDVENNLFHYAHVGDTRLYLLRDSSLVKVSKDHSFVGFLEDSGRINESAAMSHIKRNEINKALGFGKEIETQEDYIETGTSPFLPGDMLLLCSDGLTDMVNKEQITAILTANTTLEEKGKQLIDLANKNGGKDNITVVLVKNDSAPSWQATPAVDTAYAPKPEIKKKVNIIPEAVPHVVSNEEQPKTAAESSIDKPKSGSTKWIIAGLSLLCLALLASSLYLYRKTSKAEESLEEPAPVAKADNRNPDEIKLQDAINELKGDTLILVDSVYPNPILITDTLSIGQDSLYILAKGNITLKCQPGFPGPAFMLLEQSKYVVLDGITFSDFDVAVSSQNDALVLKNVQFENCLRPIQNFFVFTGSQHVNGRINPADFKADTLNINSKKPR